MSISGIMLVSETFSLGGSFAVWLLVGTLAGSSAAKIFLTARNFGGGMSAVSVDGLKQKIKL